MRKYHISMNIFWIGLSIFIMALSYKLGLGRIRSPGPGLLPFLLGLLLFPISLYSLISSFLQRNETEGSKKENGNTSNLLKVLTVTLSLLVYTFVLDGLGYLIATTLLLGILFACGGGRKRWKAVVFASILTGLITFWGFTYLGVQLPAGILGF